MVGGHWKISITIRDHQYIVYNRQRSSGDCVNRKLYIARKSIFEVSFYVACIEKMGYANSKTLENKYNDN
jgi:hypothetical protein